MFFFDMYTWILTHNTMFFDMYTWISKDLLKRYKNKYLQTSILLVLLIKIEKAEEKFNSR